MAKEKLYIGSNFGTLNFYNEDGTPLERPPFVTLHNKEEGKYFVADMITPNEDGVTYDVIFSKDVTKQMSPRLYTLEAYDDANRHNMLYHEEEYAIGTIASSTPGQEAVHGTE